MSILLTRSLNERIIFQRVFPMQKHKESILLVQYDESETIKMTVLHA